MDHIDTHLTTATQDMDYYPVSIRAMLAIGKKPLNQNTTTKQITLRCTESPWVIINLSTYFNGYDFTDIFLVLHPRHKLHYFKTAGWEDDWIETARVIVHAEFDRIYAFMDFDNEVITVNNVCFLYLSSPTISDHC